MTKDTWKKWNIYTSIHLFEYCVYSWRNHMWNHLDGFTDDDRMRELFWYYINYGNCNTYYDRKNNSTEPYGGAVQYDLECSGVE